MSDINNVFGDSEKSLLEKIDEEYQKIMQRYQQVLAINLELNNYGRTPIKKDKAFLKGVYEGLGKAKKIVKSYKESKEKNNSENTSVEFNGKKVGNIVTRKKKLFVTDRDKTTFFKKKYSGFGISFKEYSGFGISKELLEKLQETVDLIIVRYTKEDGSQELYQVPPGYWLEEGKVDQFGQFEKQVLIIGIDDLIKVEGGK